MTFYLREKGPEIGRSSSYQTMIHSLFHRIGHTFFRPLNDAKVATLKEIIESDYVVQHCNFVCPYCNAVVTKQSNHVTLLCGGESKDILYEMQHPPTLMHVSSLAMLLVCDDTVFPLRCPAIPKENDKYHSIWIDNPELIVVALLKVGHVLMQNYISSILQTFYEGSETCNRG